MTPEHVRQIEELYHAARERSPAERAALLARADPEVRREVESLLSQRSGNMLDRPAIQAAAPLLEDSTVTMLTAGTCLGPYRIESKLGEGGMGEVYRATDTRLGRAVAIKVAQQQFSARFEREARAISSLNHPNICTLYDVGSNYLVMELVEGETLAARLKKGPFSTEMALRCGAQVATALAEAHAKGVVHRDLKPSNIMLAKSGVKVLDFGLAKSEQDDTLTASHMVMGTPAYMAPEQRNGGECDARTDIYALGLILYEMATGKRPPQDQPASMDALPEGLAHVIERCLEREPERRWQTARDIGAELEWAGGRPAPAPERERQRLSAKPADQQPSIAILPFASLSADKENEYFSDGLAEEIINALANIPGIKVAGRTSSFYFRGKDVEFREIGGRLNVDHILEGSVRKAGNRIRVTAQLIKVTDGFHLWSKRYDREMTDIFAIQDEITQAVTDVLRIKLSPKAAAPLRHVPNLRAYEAYIKARDLWFKGARPELLPQFKELLERAIELDPKFALAHSFLGMYYTMQANLGIGPAREVIPLAVAAEQAALRVDPSLPEAQALLAVCIGSYDYDWNGAERHWHAAMAREPVSRDVLFWYGNHHLLPTGRTGEAIDAMSRGLEGDPLNLLYRHHFARGLRLAGRLEDAEGELREILEIDENYPHALGTLGSLCAQRGKYEEGLTFTEKAHALMPWANLVIGQLAALLARTGAARRADALIERLGPGAATGASAGLAIFHAICGEVEQAAKWTERAIERRDMQIVHSLGPFLQPTPWWPALARLMNLPA